MKNIKYVITIALFTSFFFANCQKEEVVTVLDANVTIDVFVGANTAIYDKNFSWSLFTSDFATTPLQSGTMTREAKISAGRLNHGNYMFQVSNFNGALKKQIFQVKAGQELFVSVRF